MPYPYHPHIIYSNRKSNIASAYLIFCIRISYIASAHHPQVRYTIRTPYVYHLRNKKTHLILIKSNQDFKDNQQYKIKSPRPRPPPHD